MAMPGAAALARHRLAGPVDDEPERRHGEAERAVRRRWSPSAARPGEARAGRQSRYRVPAGENVGTAAVAAVSLLFRATTYSMRSSRSIREKA